ncbi:MAG: tRNA (adenosine(37)-N6)-dimethylallyltransferase MiaA [Cryomorphaceae bacterium]
MKINNASARVPVIQGPTASGKTAVAVWLAELCGGEVISADSRQFYREMSIGTAKPDAAEMRGIPHHFINSLSVTDEYTAGRFEAEAVALADEIIARGKTPIVAGGSGLYVKAFCEGLDDLPQDDSIRDELKAIFAEKGIEPLQEMMRNLDPAYYAEADVQNPVRLMRGIELVRLSGKPMSALRAGKKKQRNFTPVKIGLELPRKELYARIDARVDAMIDGGLVAEARALHALKYRQAMQTVGYRELFAHFEGEINLDRAVELIKRNTRRYAKRQLTWLGNDPEIKMFHPDDKEGMARYAGLAKSL